ncbi:MAG: hypothetical protein V4695_11170 [Pseudomonadota bacterium]
MRELQSILQNGEALFKNAGQQLWQEYLTARECLGLQMNTPTSNALHGLTSLEESVLMRAREIVRESDNFVKRHPWRVAAAGVCIGLMVGAIIAERR